MTVIALTCQNRREITEHAGQCRNFLVYRVAGTGIDGPELLELPREGSLHNLAPGAPHALDGVDLLISASMGDGLRHKLAQRGVRTLLTTERNPLQAVQRWMAGALPDEAVPHDHGHDHGPGRGRGDGHGQGQGGGCGHCNCSH